MMLQILMNDTIKRGNSNVFFTMVFHITTLPSLSNTKSNPSYSITSNSSVKYLDNPRFFLAAKAVVTSIPCDCRYCLVAIACVMCPLPSV